MKTLFRTLLGATALLLMVGCGANPAEIRAQVEKVLDNPAAQMVLCYQQQLLRDRNLKGVVEAKFTVLAGSKAIKDVSVVSSTINNPAIEQCTVEQISRMSFPFDPKIRLTVIWPFEFSPIN